MKITAVKVSGARRDSIPAYDATIEEVMNFELLNKLRCDVNFKYYKIESEKCWVIDIIINDVLSYLKLPIQMSIEQVKTYVKPLQNYVHTKLN